MDLYDEIYYTLLGELVEGAALPWVPNAFSPGSECDTALQRLWTAKNRILQQLGTDESEDLEQILMEMETIQHSLCRTLLQLRRIETSNTSP